MAVRELVIHPDPILRQKTATVVDFGVQLHQLLDDMAESMYFHNGVGLAAPQIGVSQRVTVIDVERRDNDPKLIELVNPTIVELSDQLVEGEEGCLSFPGESDRPLSGDCLSANLPVCEIPCRLGLNLFRI